MASRQAISYPATIAVSTSCPETLLAGGEGRRHHRGTGVDNTFGMVVVVIERVRSGPVEERRPFRCHGLAGSEYRGAAGAAIEAPDRGSHQRAGLHPRVTSDGIGDDVDHQLLGMVDDLGGEVLEAEHRAELGVAVGDTHLGLPVVVQRHGPQILYGYDPR